jgi:putative endonuclease
MYFVYILYSAKLAQFYCGQSNNIDFRLKQHNNGETSSNKHGIPWELIGYLKVSTRSEAMILERKIKKRGIKRWLDEHSKALFNDI